MKTAEEQCRQQKPTAICMPENRSMHCGFIVVAICLVGILTVETLTPGQRKLFLDYHNEKRRTVQPPAADMQYMVYNETLENLAQAWVDRCKFEHPPPTNEKYRPYGQNLGITIGMKGNASINKVLNMWYKEKDNYNYESNTCKSVCGHYTQMVWHNSYMLGCAMATCKQERFNGMMGKLIACQYYARGNFRGRQPYRRR